MTSNVVSFPLCSRCRTPGCIGCPEFEPAQTPPNAWNAEYQRRVGYGARLAFVMLRKTPEELREAAVKCDGDDPAILDDQLALLDEVADNLEGTAEAVRAAWCRMMFVSGRAASLPRGDAS